MTAFPTDTVVPIVAWSGAVEPEWIDNNEHMTALAYPNLFHPKTGVLFNRIGIDAAYIAGRRLSVFQREFRLAYERELLLGDRIEIRSWLVAHDAKRMHHFHELWHVESNYRAAFVEYMSLHIDLATRRTAPFPPDVMNRLDGLAAAFAGVPMPEGHGQAIGVPSPRHRGQAFAVSK